jgi:hypothetical protein
MKTLLGVLAATIRGSSRSRVRLHTDLKVPVSSRRHRPAAAEYQIFMSRGEPPLMTTPRTFSTNILDFPARVLVISGGKRQLTRSDLIRDTVLPCTRPTCGPQFFGSRLQTHGSVGGKTGRSALGGQAAASTDGQVLQAADRLASTRARRAVAARDVRSAGTASPVPKYISSGVCPRNAEWGSTRLCSST